MSRVKVTWREFWRAAQQHMQAYRRLQSAGRNAPVRTRQAGASGNADAEPNASGYLLLYYAVECALKAKLLESSKLIYYHQLEERDQIEHHLNRGLARLHLKVRIPDAVVRSGSRERISDTELHQAWRYGKALEKSDEQRAVMALEQAFRILQQL